mgnify:FL=1
MQRHWYLFLVLGYWAAATLSQVNAQPDGCYPIKISLVESRE